MLAGISQELKSLHNAEIKSKNLALRDAACKQEIHILVSIGVWEEVNLPAQKCLVSRRWVFNRKHNGNCVVTKHKSDFFV